VTRSAPDGLDSAIAAAAADPAIFASLAEIYCLVDQELAAASAASPASLTCLGGGGCCKFDLFDHRLYASSIEIAYLLGPGRLAPPNIAHAAANRCPYQVGPRCTAYQRRVLGCRTFFCRDAAGAGQNIHEHYFQAIQALYVRHNLPYTYVSVVAAVMQPFGL
jgi:hypothetical protein